MQVVCNVCQHFCYLIDQCVAMDESGIRKRKESQNGSTDLTKDNKEVVKAVALQKDVSMNQCA